MKKHEKATFTKSCSIGMRTHLVSVDFKGDAEFCRAGIAEVTDKLGVAPDELRATTAETVIHTDDPNGFCPPCSAPVKQPPIYDVTLKDGEEIQIMELARVIEENTEIHETKELAGYILVDCLKDEYRMNPTDTTEGGWDACELRGKLNGEILNRFPDELRAAMVPFENGDLLRLPTLEEIFGDKDGNGQFKCMKRRGNRVASQGKNGTLEWWWLSSVADSTYFCNVYGYGSPGDNFASIVGGVRPRFQLRVRSES